jgi:hypothetical protein
MHQSTTYLRILMEGQLDGARRFIRRLGTKIYGEPDSTTAETLETIFDIDRLEALGDKLLQPEVKTWKDLLNDS